MDNQYIDKEKLAEKESQTQKAEKPKKNKTKVKQNILVQILNGEILTKDIVLNNMGYIFFCILLLIILVSKGYLGKQLTKDIDTSLKELDASTAEYVEAKARLEERTLRHELLRKLEPRGLKETVKPAKVIRIRNKEMD